MNGNNSTFNGESQGREEMNEKKDWIKEAIEREATPKPERTETVIAFSKRHGISSETYYYQMRKKENKAQVIEIWLNEALDGGNEVLQKLKQNALEGREKSIEMYLKFVLDLAENLDLKTDGKPLMVMSYEQAQNIIGKRETSNRGDLPK